MPDVGDPAPDFELRDQSGQPVRLSDYRGKKAVVLVFYPWAFTNTCQGELCGIRDSLDTWRNDDVETLAISVDSSPAHRAWAEQQGYEFPLLSDAWPHGEVAQRYGVFDEDLGIAHRGTFIVDREGTVRYREVSGLGDARDQDAWRVVLDEIGAAEGAHG